MTGIAFLAALRPRSVGADFTAKYQAVLAAALRASYPSIPTARGPLYGKVYYFYGRHTQLDADNLSKPVWDALEGILYDDDRVIQFRESGIIKIQDSTFETLDLTTLPGHIAEAFMALVGQVEHLLYIELGPLVHRREFTFGRAGEEGWPLVSVSADAVLEASSFQAGKTPGATPNPARKNAASDTLKQ